MGKKETTHTIIINDNIHFYKKIIFDIKSHYKNIIYYYDLFNDSGDVIRTVKHNYENKPADLLYFNYQLKSIEYWVHGKKHRKWGPAVVFFNKKKIVNEEWYHDGIKLNELEISAIKKISERKKKFNNLLHKFKFNN